MPNLDNQIKVNVIRAPSAVADDAESSSPLSIYIYIAGLTVSLSGMYAATYAMADTNFALILRALVVCGYCVSYGLRRSRVDLIKYQAPLLVLFAAVMYFVATTAPELSSATSSDGLSRPYQIQVLVIWIAVLQSFTLCADSAVLFACVPSMALIGIMSSGTPDSEVQYAFYVFLASATFLMVHENHLRTRTGMALRNRSSVRLDNRLFRGEIVLVGCCIVGTMLLATFVATPIEIVGRALIPASPQYGSKSSLNKHDAASANVHVDEGSTMQLGTGPRTESNVDLLSVTSKTFIPYLRGATYDYYSGQEFENRLEDQRSMSPTVVGQDIVSNFRGDSGAPTPTMHKQNEYDFDPYAMEPGTGRMDGATTVYESVKVLGGTITHIYGAPALKAVFTDFDNLTVSQAGEVSTSTPMVQGRQYSVASLAPSRDPNVLRLAGTNYPSSVVPRYLQVTSPLKPRNTRLQKFAEDCTKGKSNEYDKVEALRDAIANRCIYNLETPAIPRDQDVVDVFLFDTKQGYCDSFAAALTVLCRYANIPARLASGFIQGDLQNDGTYIVREKQKHAWTEVYFTNIGWVAFDATDGALGSETPASGTNRSLVSPLRWITSHGFWPPAILLLVLMMMGYVLNTELLSRYRKRKLVTAEYEALPVSNMEIVQHYLTACAALARCGFSRAVHLTPTEYRVDMTGRLPASSVAAAMLSELTNLHQVFAYGSSMASELDVIAARAALNKLIAAIALLPTPSRTDRQG